MGNGIIGAFLIVVVLAAVTIGMLAAFSMHNDAGKVTDNYGQTASAQTNKTIQIGEAVQAPMIQVQGYLLYIGVTLIICIAVLGFLVASSGQGSNRPVR